MQRLILADDSRTIQKVIRLSFAAEEVEIDSFEEGAAAWKAVQEQGADIVLADVSLPGLSGYELCRAIKEHPQHASIPVVLLASAFEPFDDERAQRARFDARLTKPFDTSALVTLVKELLASGAALPPAPAASAAGASAPEALGATAPIGLFALAHLAGPRDWLFHLDLDQCRFDTLPQAMRRNLIRVPVPAEYDSGLTSEQFDRLIRELSKRLPDALREMLPEVTRNLLQA